MSSSLVRSILSSSTGAPSADLRASSLVASVSRAVSSKLDVRSEEHTSELQSLMRISYAVFCLKKKNTNKRQDEIQDLNKVYQVSSADHGQPEVRELPQTNHQQQ